jgi:hypothetical protein
MTSRSAPSEPFDALPNPRGGSVRSAELALAEAQLAFEQHGNAAAALLRAAAALREAGWVAAQRFADALVLASPLTAAEPSDGGAEIRDGFGAALRDFRAALARHNLRELSCSPTLFTHYQALCARVAQRTPAGFGVAFDDLALARRPVPPASFGIQPAQPLAHLRARYEQALLPVLRVHSSDGLASAAASALARAAFDELDACLGELVSSDPYDFWRLAAACARALRGSGRLAGDLDARRFYARCNLALADHARGLHHAPRALVRTTLALLWRDYALFGAAAEDADQVELLHDYGLTVDWHVAGTQASEALWEAGAAHAQQAGGFVGSRTRELGVLTLNAQAYEDFLQTADASMAALAGNGHAQPSAAPVDAGAALQAAAAAYRLGAAACASGLGHVALLADALGLAWRRRAHAGAAAQMQPDAPRAAPDARALDQAVQALRAMLHTIAAGIAPPAADAALAALTRAIEQGGA